jgi:hypothetical protein
MAEMKVFDLTFQDESGKVYDAQIEAPADASTADLQAAAAQYLATARPQTAFPAAIVKTAAPIPIPTKEEAAKQIAATSAQTAATKKAREERGVLEAFTQGFMAPRQEDPFGLQGLTPGEARALPLVQLLNYAREGVQSGLSGLAEAGGQAAYNLGLRGQGTEYDPTRIGKEFADFAEKAGLILPVGPLRAEAATTEFVLPSVKSAMQTIREAAIKAPEVGPSLAQRTFQAAQRHGVRLMPADVGGPTLQRLTAGTQQSVTGTTPISEAASQTVADLAAAAGRAADTTGTVGTSFETGTKLKDAALMFATQTSQRGGRLYDRVKDKAQDVVFRPLNAVKEIDRKIDQLRLKNDPSDPILRYLEEKRTQLSQPFGYEGLKGVLSDLKKDHRQRDDLMLRSSDAKRELGDVVRALETDMTDTLVKVGKPGAASAFKTANQYWRARVETIDDALEPIIGNASSGEQVVASINTMTRGGKGGVARLGRVINALPESDRGDVRATIIDGLGMVSNKFDPTAFMKNWEKITPEAKQALFGKDKGLLQSLNDIALLADQTKQAQRFMNASQTAGALQVNNIFNQLGGALTVGGAATGTGTLTGVGLATILAPLVLGRLSAKALTSQRLVRYLANAPKTVKSADQFRAGLLDVASKTPAISAEIEAIVAEMEGQ